MLTTWLHYLAERFFPTHFYLWFLVVLVFSIFGNFSTIIPWTRFSKSVIFISVSCPGFMDPVLSSLPRALGIVATLVLFYFSLLKFEFIFSQPCPPPLTVLLPLGPAPWLRISPHFSFDLYISSFLQNLNFLVKLLFPHSWVNHLLYWLFCVAGFPPQILNWINLFVCIFFGIFIYLFIFIFCWTTSDHFI